MFQMNVPDDAATRFSCSDRTLQTCPEATVSINHPPAATTPVSRWNAGAIHRFWCCQGTVTDAEEGRVTAEACGDVDRVDRDELGPVMTACALVPMKANALTPQRMASVVGSGRGPYLSWKFVTNTRVQVSQWIKEMIRALTVAMQPWYSTSHPSSTRRNSKGLQ